MPQIHLLPGVLLILLLTACAPGASQAQTAANDKLKIVTTIGQIGDAARHVGGQHVDVTSLMGPGVDPHLYVASESDVARLARSDGIPYNGLFL
jgi:manganese/zinc/iron transport system substrate-binding protein